MRIRIRLFPLIRIWIRLFTLIRILFQIKAQTLKNVLIRLIFHTFLACHLQIDADPDFYFMRMRIRTQVTKMMRIHEDSDPQHCNELNDVRQERDQT
jgi:hypothetical protein